MELPVTVGCLLWCWFGLVIYLCCWIGLVLIWGLRYCEFCCFGFDLGWFADLRLFGFGLTCVLFGVLFSWLFYVFVCL